MKKIAILAPNKDFFGATIVQFPFFQSLKAAYPDSEIKVWSSVKIANVLKKYSLCDEVIDDEKKGFFSFLSSLRNYSPDLIINMRPFSEKTSLVTLLTSARKKISFTKKKNGNGVYQNTQVYIAYSYLDLLNPLKIDQDRNFELFGKLISTSNYEIPNDKKNIVFIVAGGEKYKRWGIENFLKLIDILGKDSFCYHFVLGGDEVEYLEDIKKKNLTHYQIHQSRSIEDLGKLFTSSDLVISNDCGPSHIAQLSHCKYLSLWGWGLKPLFPRFGEWFYPHENSYTLMTKHGVELPELAPERVAKMALGLINFQ
jgi:ADP-heptose:LPS heptosyltransferase